MSNDYLYMASKGFNWDPACELVESSKASIDKTAIVWATQQYLIDNSDSGDEEYLLDDLFGSYPYENNRMPLANCLLLIAGVITLDDFNSIPVGPDGRYGYALDSGVVFVEQVMAVGREIFNLNYFVRNA